MDKNIANDINRKLNFLLEDHDVTFDDSNMALDSLDTFHEKADALLVAHNCEIPEVAHDIAGLQPKLNMLIQGHGAEFDDSNLDPNSIDTVLQKLEILQDEHGA